MADPDNHRIRKITSDGRITTIVGDGLNGCKGDGGPATEAEVFEPEGLAVDSQGNLLIADTYNSRIRMVSARGIIRTVAGFGNGVANWRGQGYSGDKGPATRAMLNNPQGVAVDPGGNLLIADTGNTRVRKVDLRGIISTLAGGSNVRGDFSNNTKAAEFGLGSPTSIAVGGHGDLYVTDPGNNRVRKITPQGIIVTVAGTGRGGFSGDGGPGIHAMLHQPRCVITDPQGDLFIADTSNNRVRRLSPEGIITTIAGNGLAPRSGLRRH